MITEAFSRALDLHKPSAINVPQEWQEGYDEAMAARKLANQYRASLTDDSWPFKVASFRRLFQREMPTAIRLLTSDEAILQRDLLQEEFNETIEGLETDNLAEQVDGLLDLIYIALGWLLNLGLTPVQINMLMEEVHASNMTKVDDEGNAIINTMVAGILKNPDLPEGKVLKSANYIPANIRELLASFT